MPVDGSDVFEAEVLEEALRRHHVFEALLEPVDRAVDRTSDDRGAAEGIAPPVEDVFVAAGRAQGREVVGETTLGRRIRARVVVDDDDEREVLVGGDVVDRLPRHASRERAVTDDRDGMPVGLAAQASRLGDPVGPRQRGRGVGVFDDVMLGLAPAGVARQSSAGAQPREVPATGEDLVDVGLVARVEDDGVLRGVENPVDRDGEFDDAEVRSEVTTRTGNRVDEESADLLRQQRHVARADELDVRRPVNGIEQCH